MIAANEEAIREHARQCGLPASRISELLREGVLDNFNGLGTGKLREHYEGIAKGGGKFYLSGMSSKARGVTDADLKGRPAEFALPEVLLRLSLEHDRMFTY